MVVDDAEEALAVANNSIYGLSSGIITNDFNRALDTGMVHIGDQTVNDEPQVPFGSVKGNGCGRTPAPLFPVLSLPAPVERSGPGSKG